MQDLVASSGEVANCNQLKHPHHCMWWRPKAPLRLVCQCWATVETRAENHSRSHHMIDSQYVSTITTVSLYSKSVITDTLQDNPPAINVCVNLKNVKYFQKCKEQEFCMYSPHCGVNFT